MAIVKELITHILHHVNAEDATRDQSQVAGVSRRAQLVRDSVATLKTDTRDVSLDTILADISSATALAADQASFKKAIQNIRDDGTRPQLAIQKWVSKKLEGREIIDG